MQSPIIEYLDWDSRFFDKKIGRINFDNNHVDELGALLDIATFNNYDLIYVFEDANNTSNLVEKYKHNLVDIKVLFSKPVELTIKIDGIIEDNESIKSTETIDALAIASGEFSRFNTDIGFTTNSFHDLYKTWIRESMNKNIADKVYFHIEDKQITGLITIKKTKNIGVIGLVSVSDNYRGMGIGKCLINTCNNYLFSNNVKEMQVATQSVNIPAVSFYKKVGFEIKNCTNIYHFWL